MNPQNLNRALSELVDKGVLQSVMIWGPPGIGKSRIVEAVARKRRIDFVDLRISQLAPTDLRGLPVADREAGCSRWLPPEFLPRKGKGILFLDELNLSPPAIQAIAQQLVLDRRVGSYVVPGGWHIWAAGNRQEDRASVYEMPAPLANRFLHFEVTPDIVSFRNWALEHGLHEYIVAFLSFRPALLHQPHPQRHAWPSPRTWEMADRLYREGLDVSPAVGDGAAGEFVQYLRVIDTLPVLEGILGGDGHAEKWPEEPSRRFAITIALCARAVEPDQLSFAFQWLLRKAEPEWCQLFLHSTLERAQRKGRLGHFAHLVKQEPRIREFLGDYKEILKETS